MRSVRAGCLVLIGIVMLAGSLVANAAVGEAGSDSAGTPKLVEVNGSAAVLQWLGQAPTRLEVGQVYRDWELLAILRDASPVAVLEHRSTDASALVYVGQNGIVDQLSKAVAGPDDTLSQRVFPSSDAKRILASQQDDLGNEVLARRQDPTYADMAALLPRLDGYTFLGTLQSHEKVIVWPDGRLGLGIHNHNLVDVLMNPSRLLHIPVVEQSAKREGLIGGYLPVIDYNFFNRVTNRGLEEIAFAAEEDDPTTYVCLRPKGGKAEYWKLPGPQRLLDGTDFYRELLAMAHTWDRFFNEGMQVHIPEARVENASKAAIIHGLLSEVGLHPKYGVGRYAQSEHDAFPPTTIQLVSCLLDWGHAGEAGERLGFYLSHYVKEDGTLDYYGPALSEYGQLLALAARYVRVSGDNEWLKEHSSELHRIAQYITAQLHASRDKYPEGSPYHGLLWGSGEADTASDRQFYFSGNVWCWRGLHDLSEVLTAAGQQPGNSASEDYAKQVGVEASELRTDVLAALNRSFQRTTPPFLPPVAGNPKPFARMAESEFASYTNYRYWLEMLSAGLLSPSMSDAIISYRRTHGGEVGATTRFEGHLDDWTYANYAWGLIEQMDISHYLLGFYGHMAYSQTPDTFTAYEQAAVKGVGSRTNLADYCVPSQVVTPQMLRWMLVWEPWDKAELWIGRAIPKPWLETGFSASAIPTRWGPVSIEEKLQGSAVTMKVAVSRADPELSVYLPVRIMAGKTPPKVSVEGVESWEWDANRNAVKLTGVWSQATICVEP